MKNIIFDLGGVLINIDAGLTITAFKNLGVENFDKIFTLFTQNETARLYEKGLISDKDFRNSVRQHSNINITDEDIDKAWNAMLLDFPLARIDMLVSLRKKYKIFLLSNTNNIHYVEFQKQINALLNPNQFDSLFDEAYYSFQMGMRKPDAEIFEYVLNENNLSKAETLFIDDNPENIEAAKKLGIATYNLAGGQEIVSVIKDLLN